MRNKKINEMTKEELLMFISDTANCIGENLKHYNIYYNNKISEFKKVLNIDTIIYELRNNAYFLKDAFEHTDWAYNKQIIINSIPLKSNIKPRRGEIWTCQLGKNIGSEEDKIRPVVIIQNDTGNEKSPTTIIVPISNRPKKISIHITLRDSDYDLVEGEIDKITGTILCEQIRVVAKVRLGRHIGTLKEEFINNILNIKLKNSIEL